MQEERDSLRHYQIYIPVKSGDMFFSGADVQLESSFKMSLDFNKSYEYEGDYYIAYLAINPILENKINLQIGYNSLNKARTAIAFCGNFQIDKLDELLKVKPPKKMPQVPAPLPPELDKDDV